MRKVNAVMREGDGVAHGALRRGKITPPGGVGALRAGRSSPRNSDGNGRADVLELSAAARKRLAAALEGHGYAGAAELVGCTPEMLRLLGTGKTTRVSAELAKKIRSSLGVRL